MGLRRRGPVRLSSGAEGAKRPGSPLATYSISISTYLTGKSRRERGYPAARPSRKESGAARRSTNPFRRQVFEGECGQGRLTMQPINKSPVFDVTG